MDLRSTKFKQSFSKLTEEINKTLPEDKKITKKFNKIFDDLCEKYKIISKLNKLDQYIRDGLVTNRDLKSEDYIKEIYLSYTVEDNDQLSLEIVDYENKLKNKIEEMNNQIKEFDDEIENIKINNIECEKRYQRLLERVGNIIKK